MVWLEEEDEVELLFAAEELDAAWVVVIEVAEVCLVEGEVEIELLSAAGEELDIATLLPSTTGKLEDVTALGALDDRAGVFEVLSPPDDDTVVTVVSTGWAGSLSIFRYRKSFPYLSIVILKN